VAAEQSWFATPEILVGCYPPVALARFSTLIGYHRAAEMILTGRRFNAREARELGLVNRVFVESEFAGGVQALLDELLAQSGAVLRLAVQGLRELALGDFHAALKRSEAIYCNQLLKTQDVEEGVKAFLEKRPPRWAHR
jgi:cyclohexa-1,5-dienecarbonyl-CoA hydratase